MISPSDSNHPAHRERRPLAWGNSARRLGLLKIPAAKTTSAAMPSVVPRLTRLSAGESVVREVKGRFPGSSVVSADSGPWIGRSLTAGIGMLGSAGPGSVWRSLLGTEAGEVSVGGCRREPGHASSIKRWLRLWPTSAGRAGGTETRDGCSAFGRLGASPDSSVVTRSVAVSFRASSASGDEAASWWRSICLGVVSRPMSTKAAVDAGGKVGGETRPAEPGRAAGSDAPRGYRTMPATFHSQRSLCRFPADAREPT